MRDEMGDEITDGLHIDCDDCTMAGTSACDDCIVTFIVNRPPREAVVVDADHLDALRLLKNAGLVPGSRHQARAS
jgi:hypothetical protein